MLYFSGRLFHIFIQSKYGELAKLCFLCNFWHFVHFPSRFKGHCPEKKRMFEFKIESIQKKGDVCEWHSTRAVKTVFLLNIQDFMDKCVQIHRIVHKITVKNYTMKTFVKFEGDIRALFMVNGGESRNQRHKYLKRGRKKWKQNEIYWGKTWTVEHRPYSPDLQQTTCTVF